VTAETNLPPEVAVLDQRVFRNDTDGSWRLALLLDAPKANGPLELRARLLLEGKPITETWVNPWQP
jgi:glucan biosynthesis protein